MNIDCNDPVAAWQNKFRPTQANYKLSLMNTATISGGFSRSDYELQSSRSTAAADLIVPILCEVVRPKSVIDVGCGVGAWLRGFQSHGVERVLGVDGGELNSENLLIPLEQFRSADLTRGFNFGVFDLAVSLEVAEHLPFATADALIDSLCQSAETVAFSAAIPRQGGVDHINEQWQSFWAAKFCERGFHCIDAVRPRIYGNLIIPYYYRQNILIYTNKSTIIAENAANIIDDDYRMNHVCPDFYESRSRLFESMMSSPKNFKSLLGAFEWAIKCYVSK